MKYGIFERAIRQTLDGSFTITFSCLPTIADKTTPLILEAETVESAAEKAADLLALLSINTHSIKGNPNSIMEYFPDYFVAQFATETAYKYDTSSLAYQISSFTAVPRKS